MPDIHKINEDEFFDEPAKKTFWDHFDNNVMEIPRSWWRRAWNWTPLYWLRCHTFTKYHMVDCRTPEYRWGWIDRSEVLLNASFNILVEFIDLEKPGQFIEWESDPDHSHAWKEMNELYRWWKHDRVAEHRALSAILDAVPHRDFDDMFEKLPEGNGYLLKPETEDVQEIYRKYGEEERRLEKKDQDNLHRLIEIRQYLWT